MPDGKSERIIIPFFSHGFQGAVFGFFHGLQPHLKEPVLNLLYQYGQSLADSYALLRRQEFLRATAEANDAETVAAATLRIVSPVEQLVIETQGRVHGFVLREEDGYWAGFDEVRMPEAATLRDRLSNDDACRVSLQNLRGQPVKIFLKPIQNQPALDPVFTWLRLDARLMDLFTLSASKSEPAPIARRELEAMKTQIENQIGAAGNGLREAARGDFGKAKRLCLIEIVLENYPKGEVEITNNIMKVRLERKLGELASKGNYQVAGKALDRLMLDLDEDFKERVLLEPVGKDRVKMSWLVADEPG